MGVYCFVLVMLASTLGSGFARSPPCIRECPQDCGQTERSDGCLECICDQPGFPGPPPPRNPNDDSCPTVCPQDCGQTRQENGCLKCICGANPFVKPTRPPRKSRQTDSELCAEKCIDCGCIVKDGEAECDCTPGPNHPLIEPPIQRPSQRDRRYSVDPAPEPVDDGTLCRQKCPADCGCIVNEGEAQCHCTAENHPLIKPPPPPTPPRPYPVTSPPQDDGTICRLKCPADCGCTVNEAREAQCHCTAENHPLIKKPPPPPPPRPEIPPPQDDGTICRLKCPADCGCTVNEAREAQCHCTAENHPLIKKPPPPPPPRPEIPPPLQDDGTLCRLKCPADCGCTVNEAREAQCHCTAENHPLIKPPPPTTAPPRIYRQVEDDATLCRRKCPADCGCTLDDAREATCHCNNNPFGRPPPPPPPRVQCSPPRCEEPCKMNYNDKTAVCPYCQCPDS